MNADRVWSDGAAELREQAATLRERQEQEAADPMEQQLQTFGIVNRATARQRGFRNPPRPQVMAVPKSRKRPKKKKGY